MRIGTGLIFAGAVSLLASSAAWSQLAGNKSAAAPQAAPSVTAPAPAKAACANPNALGIGRTVEIDTTGGPGFGFEHFKQLDFLRDHEVVLTFDDGPWPVNTPSVLKTLADECTTGIFFPIGKHATYYPEILKQVAAAGHTVGSHTWSHANLNNKKLNEEQRKEEIEKGFSAVKWALGGSPAPFFRFPALQHPPEMVTYLGSRNVAIFSCDLDSFDFKASKPQTVIDSVMRKVDKLGKGIVLSADVIGRRGYRLPLYSSDAIGANRSQVDVANAALVDMSQVHTEWTAKLRIEKTFVRRKWEMRLVGELMAPVGQRDRTVVSPSTGFFNSHALRIGIVLGF